VVSEEKIFLEINQSETRMTCGSHVCKTDRDEMSNLYRGPCIDAFYQVSGHLAMSFGGEFFFKSSNQKQEWPVVAMFVNGSGRNEQSL
jgi:hypothetical protein